MKRLREERARNRRLKRKMREAQQKHDPSLILTSSDDSDEAELESADPETRMIIRFEEHLKRRIFLADRIEKVEKALVSMGLISKDCYFCSDFELTRFKEAIA